MTLWGTCGRYSGRNYHEWDGVVCLGQSDNVNKDGKVSDTVGTCGRYSGRNYHEWDGVVCLGQSDNVNKDGKVSDTVGYMW